MASLTRACPKCGNENALDSDFCAACGEYLRWEPTRQVAAAKPSGPAEQVPPTHVPPEPASPAQPLPATPSETLLYPAASAEEQPTAPAAAPAPPPEPQPDGPAATPAAPLRPDSVVLTLRVADAESAGPGPIEAGVEAGGQAVLIALVRNQSGIVDSYSLRVHGLPEDWWTVTPGTVYLVPFGSASEGYEQEVEIRLHPPRSHEAEARSWPLEVVAVSVAHGVEAGSVPASLVIGPFYELDSELRPERSRGRLRGRHAIAVRNRGNASAEVALNATDPENLLRFGFDQSRFHIDPGRRGGTAFKVHPPKQILVGRPIDRRFEIAPQAVGVEAAAPPRQGVFRQHPWLPWWLLAAVPVVAALGVAVWQLLPNTASVPDLTAAGSVFGAQQILAEAGLELGEATEEKTEKAKPGTILAQAPAAGREVDKGSAVDIKIAVGTGKAKVPRIVGLTLAEADAALRKAGFQLGQARPEPGDPRKDAIASQIPSEGAVADRGAPVDIFFPVEEEKAKAEGEAPAEEGGKPEPPPTVAVPLLVERGTDAALDALAKAGLVPVEVRRFSPDVAAGKLIAQIPAAGAEVARGSKVTLVVSAGFPQVVFDRNGDLLVAAGAVGKPVKPLAASEEVEEQPTWSPSGTLIAYRRAPSATEGRIWLVTPGQPDSARPLTTAGFDDRRPAFSPDGKVIAFVRGDSGGSDTDLCFQRVGGEGEDASCIEDPERKLSRPTWSPDGKSILVVASDPAEEQVELLLYTSGRASSPRASDWASQGLVTDKLHGKRKGDQVVAADWRPDGKEIAFSANWGEDFFHLLLAPVSQGLLGTAKAIPRIRACELAWRPDGGELVITRRDATCNQAGEIVRVAPSKPAEQISLTKAGASNPAWEPLALGG